MNPKNQLLSIPAQEYHAAEGVSASMLDLIRDCPLKLRFALDAGQKEETDAMRLGTLVHRAILEPDTWEGAVHVKPEGMSFASKDGKAWREDHADKPIITAEENSRIEGMRKMVWGEPMVRALLSGGYAEQSLFVEDEHGTLRKSRFDYLAMSGNVIPDLKTCRSAKAEDFEKSILNLSYYVRAAYYLENANLAGMDKEKFVFICVETEPPYAVALYDLDEAVIRAGRMIYERDLMVYRKCMETGRWPSYHDGIARIGLPPWAQRTMEEQL